MNSNLLTELYDAALPNLSDDLLKKLAGLDSSAEMECSSVSNTLTALAQRIEKDQHTVSIQPFDLYMILIGLADRVNLIDGMISVSSEASYQLEKRKQQAEEAGNGR